MDAAEWIEALQLERHPEGGYYRQTYVSPDVLLQTSLPNRFKGNRAASTAIYFLLSGSDFSALHRIQSDEIWHFYAGTGVLLHIIHPDGHYEMIRLGPDIRSGQTFQAVAPFGSWFGACLEKPEGFALVGCTVAPGFDFSDFELADREELTRAYPQHTTLIHQLTHPGKVTQ
jgi:predicted cupin superfamily sugar epimerase